MAKRQAPSKDIQETLKGMEIRSIQFEGLVTVKGDTVVLNYSGKVITPTQAQWNELLNEATREEFGSETAMEKAFQEEFGPDSPWSRYKVTQSAAKKKNRGSTSGLGRVR